MSALVAAMRTLIGKPFKHRGRGPNFYDCAGAAKHAFLICGADVPDFLKYGREPHQDGLIGHISTALGEPVAVAPVRDWQLRVGDVVVLRFEVEPHHVAIVGDYVFGGLSLIHACGHSKKVIEHRLAADQIARITHVFRKSV